jgi:HAD superfamily hydrolase (TIGR01490 family)
MSATPHLACAHRRGRVAAFFDLDGTLCGAPSIERRFVRFLIRSNKIGIVTGFRWLAHLASGVLSGSEHPVEANKAGLAGISASAVDEWADSLGSACEPLGFFDDALRVLAAHHAAGHPVFIITGTLAPLGQVVAARLPVAAWIAATELETRWQGREAVWTGSISGEHMSGSAKVKAMESLASQCGLDLAQSYAYGDSVRDIPMLERVGYVVAVNPTARLARRARLRGWPIHNWGLDRLQPPNAYGRAHIHSQSRRLGVLGFSATNGGAAVATETATTREPTCEGDTWGTQPPSADRCNGLRQSCRAPEAR